MRARGTGTTQHNAAYRAPAERRDFRRADGVIVDAERLLEHEELARLVEVAEERGRVRASQLNEVLEPLQLDALESESVYRELEKRAIEVIEDRRDEDERRPAYVPVPLESTTDALQLFLREATRHPLLTAAQEVALAKRIER